MSARASSFDRVLAGVAVVCALACVASGLAAGCSGVDAARMLDDANKAAHAGCAGLGALDDAGAPDASPDAPARK